MGSAYPGALDNFATNRADGVAQLTTHAADHNNENDAINKIEAELGTNPSAGFATVSDRLDAFAPGNGLPWIDARDYGFTENANGVNVNTAWDSLITYLAGSSPANRVVVFPAGDFVMTAAKTLPNKSGMRLIGSAGHVAQASGITDRYSATTFRWTGAGSSTMLTMDGGTSVVKGGPVIEHLNFFNGTAGPDYTVNALRFDNVNDGKMVSCGFQSFGRNITLEATGGAGPDCAHWSFYDLWSYGSDYHIYGDSGFGYEAQGGEIIGEGSRTSYAYYSVNFAEITITGSKAVGCKGGVFVGAGGYHSLFAVRGEQCGDATHPVVDFSDGGGGGADGSYLRLIGCNFSGTGTQLPTRLGTGTDWCTVVGTVHDAMAAHSGLTANQVKFDANSSHVVIDAITVALGNSPAGFGKLAFGGGQPATKPSLPDGSTLPQVIDALQALGLVSP